MSVAELKLVAIAEISKLEDENDLKEILDHLNKLKTEPKPLVNNLSQHFDKVNAQYYKTLKN